MTITISGETLEDIKQQIRAIESKQISIVQGGSANAVTSQAVAAQASAQTLIVPQDPTGVPYCVHGPMNWREGISKAGAPYAGHYCTAKDQSIQCRPVFPKKQIPADQKNTNYNDPL